MRQEVMIEKARIRRKKILELRESGMTLEKIGRRYKISKQQVFRLVKRAYRDIEQVTP